MGAVPGVEPPCSGTWARRRSWRRGHHAVVRRDRGSLFSAAGQAVVQDLPGALTLAVAYVGIPYWAGVVVVGESLRATDLPLMTALYLLFAGRIILKDFRDREGDAAFGKPTFLLKYGKRTTCLASLCALCTGDALLVASLADNRWLAVLLQLYIVSIAVMLYRLYRLGGRKDEQLSIGVGAKMGNGLLVTLLGALILSNQGADWITQFIFGLALTAIYMLNFIDFLRHPERAVVGYKG